MLTNAGGFTLYWFAPDTATRSNCSGSCTAYWPPLTGIPAAGPDVTGRLGTITRSDGATQATYNGHPSTPTSATPAPARPTATTST